jgi:hypothetical protein
MERYMLRQPIISVAAAILCAAGSTSRLDAAQQSFTSKQFLLSPRVTTGERIVWLAHYERFDAPDSGEGRSVTLDTSRFNELTCNVIRTDADSFAANTSLRAGFSLKTMGVGVSRPPSSYGGGRALRQDGSPDTVGCKIFATWELGSPPPVIAVGTKWTFQRPDWAPEPADDERGTTTVLAIDSAKGTVHLNATLTSEGKVVEKIDATIIDGGLISHEVTQAFLSPVHGLGRNLMGPFIDLSTVTLERNKG